MNFFEGFFQAISNSFKGIGILFEKGLWVYLFYPLILWVIMWGVSIWLFADLAGVIANQLNNSLSLNEIPDSGSWLSFAKPFLTGYFSFIIAWIIKIVLWFISSTFSKYIILILLSPLFSLLSESLDEKLTGKNYPFNGIQLIKDIFRGIGISIRNMVFEYFLIAICFVVSLLFPPLVIITAPFLMFVSWYFIGFTMLDYNFERYKMSISQSVQFVRNNKGLACGIGVVYSFFMILPVFIGMMFGPVLAVVAATMCFIEIKKQNTPIIK